MSEPNETLWVVMPAYNEEENIEQVVEEWYPKLELAGEGSQLVVADGGSRDRTLDVLKELEESHPLLRVISAPGTDHGTKVLLLYRMAVDTGADWVFQTDSDGQTLASEFPAFWDSRDGFDAVMGNRVVRGDGMGRKLVEDVLRCYVRAFFGVWVPDANAPFRLMRAGVLKGYLGLMPDVFALPNAVVAACLGRYGARVEYREVTFRPRQGGANYINVRRIVRIGLGTLRDFAGVLKAMRSAEKAGELRRSGR